MQFDINAQLVEDLCCTVIFNHKLCVIQDRTTKMLIGSSEQRKGVYFFKEHAMQKSSKQGCDVGSMASENGSSIKSSTIKLI